MTATQAPIHFTCVDSWSASNPQLLEAVRFGGYRRTAGYKAHTAKVTIMGDILTLQQLCKHVAKMQIVGAFMIISVTTVLQTSFSAQSTWLISTKA